MSILGHPGIAWTTSLLYVLFFWKELSGYAKDQGEGVLPVKHQPGLIHWFILPLIILHGVVLHESIFTAEGFIFGFSQALSAMAWIGVTFFWFENWYLPLRGLRSILFILAAVCIVLPALFGGGYALSDRALQNPWFKVHFIMANMAYGLLALATLHAFLMHWQDRHLHHLDKVSRDQGQWLNRLPPLLTMESILFRMIRLGFVLLTLTVFTGLFFSQTLFGRALVFDHKTVFGLVSWLMYAGLLIARYRSGLRGLLATRWAIGAFVMMLLAYIGSRFVLEVILQR